MCSITENETELVLQTARALFKPDSIINLPNILTASEDFSEYLSLVPSCFSLIGAGVHSAPVHTDKFDFPDEVIRHAALTMCQIAMNYLNNK